jgi:hypothetical protein
MAKEYYEKLQHLIELLDFSQDISTSIEIKHFFSGAALYIKGGMCASLSPVGLAFKLPVELTTELINQNLGTALKYFPKGNIKKDYVVFSSPDLTSNKWKDYFLKAFKEVAN